MKKKMVLWEGIGTAALAALLVFGLVFLGCDNGTTDDDDDDGGGNNNSKVEKSLKVTGLGDFTGEDYLLGVANTVDKLQEEDVVAYAEGTITGSTVTAALLEPDSDDPWTGTGSYYVGVILDSGTFVSKSKKSFSSAVTTMSIDDFE